MSHVGNLDWEEIWRRQAVALESIEEHLQTIASVMVTDKIDSNNELSTQQQLLGNTTGFVEELAEILDETDAFRRAKRLRDLVDTGRAIAKGFAENIEKLKLADGQGETQAEAGQREEIQDSSP